MSEPPPPYQPYPPAPLPPPGPPGYPQWPYGMPPPPPARPTSNTTAALIVALAVVGILLLGTVAAAFVYLYSHRAGAGLASSSSTPSARPSASPSPGVTATSELRVDEGSVVFSDDFSDPNSGWYVGTYASGTSFAYSSKGYVVSAKGNLTHFVDAPYGSRLSQVSMAVTGTQAGGAPPDAGFGVSCVTEAGTVRIRYALVVEQASRFEVLRFNPDAPGTLSDVIRSGSSPAAAGSAPLTMTGICATLSDHHTIRLALFVGGTLVADLTDTLDATVFSWSASLAFNSDEAHPSSDTVTNFVERDLTR